MAVKKVKRPVLSGEKKQLNEFAMMKPASESHVISSEPSEDITIFPYKIQGNDLLVWDDKRNEYVHVCKAAKIKQITRNIENKDITIELAFWAYDKWEVIKINRGELNKRDLKKLASKGMDIIQDSQATHVLSFLSKQEKEFTPMNVHTGLGWELLNGEMMYKHHHLIGNSRKPVQSTYAGEFNIQPKGSINDYMNLFLKEVKGYAPLEFMFCVGLSALIVGFANRFGIADIDTLLVHLAGRATTGKTTAAMLAVSVAGYPGVNGKGLIQTYNGTKNAMSRLIEGNYGVPIVFDEFSMNQMDAHSLSSFQYELAQNRGRLRLNKESELKQVGTWCTTVISTGENSIIHKLNQNEGLRVRLFEFSGINWTRSAENAERLKEGLIHHYGHVAPMIAKKMIEYGPEKISEMLKGNKEYFKTILPESRLLDRIAGKFSLILTAAEIFEETFGIELCGDKIVEMLVEQEKSSINEREPGPKFYQQIKQFIIQYRKNFKIPNQPVSNYQEIWGRIEVSEDRTLCFILPQIFQRIIQEYNYTDQRTLIDELKKMGVLQHDKDKNQKRKVIFSKDEVQLREKMLGKSGYSDKGDYTYCIVYEENIFKGLLD
ncbi:DUF927 domain-containing protein [Parageobacillus toebii]|uniref:DUF927 domain-containing protein n=1 Tax=Parageobacillus toebii TaxID=153151 RepID=UPI002814C821|nr:DUF927 domain-containing protein [Parageobacillus toebii]WMT20054.1 DUF927 domain-containing protein [Parageobacillus toebii]